MKKGATMETRNYSVIEKGVSIKDEESYVQLEIRSKYRTPEERNLLEKAADAFIEQVKGIIGA